jgi:pimeloyl-ACP methyl ester carboxylesterase
MNAPLVELTLQVRGLSFPALSCGSGPLVLCLHGFPDGLRSFRHQLPALAAAGFRVVAPALRGYAPSCLPPLNQCNVLEVARDVIAMVEALGEPSAHLVGHDWGAAAAYLAGALSPVTFRSLSTLAVPHPLGFLLALTRVPTQLRNSWYMFFFQVPRAEQAFSAMNFALLEKLWRDWSPGFSLPQDELDDIKRTFRRAGVTAAALAYYRNMFDPSSSASREARTLLSRPITVPTLALTGADDGCIDTRVYDHAMGSRWFSDVIVERMQGVGHFLHQEAPARTNSRLLAWLAQHATTRHSRSNYTLGGG